MMVHVICINGIKRKLLSSAMKMRKRSPLIPLGMQRMNCYALMSFMTWR